VIEMEIYGADFSSARDPRGGIYYAMGRMWDLPNVVDVSHDRLR